MTGGFHVDPSFVMPIAAEPPTEPAMPPSQPTEADRVPADVASVLRQLAGRARTQPFNFDEHLWQSHQRRDFARWLDNRAAEFEQSPVEEVVPADHGPVAFAFPSLREPDLVFVVPEEVYDAGYRPPGAEIPTDGVEDTLSAEIDDHLRDVRQGLITIAAELDQIGESTQALLSSRLYWGEFTETADGPDFATELANAGTTVRHLQRILADAVRRSTL